MGANMNIPKNAEKFCGSFYKDDFSEFYPESVFRSENGSKLSIFGPKYVFFVNSVPDVCQIIKILKIYLLMLPMRIFCYLWNFRTTSQKKVHIVGWPFELFLYWIVHKLFRCWFVLSLERWYRISSFLDIWQKFRKYGKSKGTFRGSNLAKESVSDLFIGLRDILMLYLDMFWPWRIEVFTKIRKMQQIDARKVLPVELSRPQKIYFWTIWLLGYPTHKISDS